MKRIFIGAIAAAFLLAIPSLAGAHSGAVSCDSGGVLFTYNADFATAKTATEHVGSAVYTFNITPHVVNTHLVPLPTTSPVVVSATWGGPGSIIPRALNCPTAPPVCDQLTGRNSDGTNCSVPNPTPPVCPAGYTTEPSPNVNMVLCTRTVTNTLPAAPVPPVYYKCPKGTKLVSYKSGATICLKYKNKVKIVTKIKRIFVDVPDDKPTPPRGGGVAG